LNFEGFFDVGKCFLGKVVLRGVKEFHGLQADQKIISKNPYPAHKICEKLGKDLIINFLSSKPTGLLRVKNRVVPFGINSSTPTRLKKVKLVQTR